MDEIDWLGASILSIGWEHRYYPEDGFAQKPSTSGLLLLLERLLKHLKVQLKTAIACVLKVTMPTLAYVVVSAVLLLKCCCHLALGTTSLSVRAPVNPVDEGGILSLHCEVKNLERWHEVTIFRNVTTHTEKLSVNGDVLPAVDDRVFLAMRQVDGPAFVYFLSVIFATKADTGEYFCKVSDVAGRLTNLPVGSVFIETTFFPPVTDPVCTPSGQLTVVEGNSLTLACSSETARPTVQVKWYRTGSEKYLKSTDDFANGRVVSSLSVTLTKSDSGAIFMCRITSVAYHDRVQTCHTGPVTVLSTNGDNNGDFMPSYKPSTPSKGPPPGSTGVDRIPITIVTTQTKECVNTCSVSNSTSVLYWILATVMTGVFAVILFVMVLVLLFKCRHGVDTYEESNLPTTTTYVTATPGDGIYTELECRRIHENKVYLPIQNVTKHDLQ